MRLDIYDESLILNSFDDATTWTRSVSADQIANTFIQHMGANSGLLPPDTLWWKQSETGQVIALWRPPQTWPVALQDEAFQPPTRMRLPMPGLVFICSPQRPPWVFAAKARPASPYDQLYRAPTFNTYSDGNVCPGSHRFPPTLDEIPESFFQSFFSHTGDSLRRSRKYPDNLRDLWEELDGKPDYPLDDLVEQDTVAHAMALPQRRLRNW